MSERGFFGAAENTLLVVSYCEDHGWLRVDADTGGVGATQEGIDWLDERDALMGYEIEWEGIELESEVTTNRILVHASLLLGREGGLVGKAGDSGYSVDDELFREALDKLVPANAVRYDGGMEEVN